MRSSTDAGDRVLLDVDEDVACLEMAGDREGTETVARKLGNISLCRRYFPSDSGSL